MQNELSVRKSIRLKNYDYSQGGAYFVTVCAHNRHHLFGRIVGADDPVRPRMMEKSEIGEIVTNCWHEIDRIYENIKTDAFCIMPNHIHGIIIIGNESTTGGQVVRPYKG